MYDCLVLCDKSSKKPVRSLCSCTVGQGEACTHTAALLFALEDFISLGHHMLPDDPASTEILCSWNAPKDSKVVYIGRLFIMYFNMLIYFNIYFNICI